MLAGCSPEGRLYAVNMAFTNQSTASTDAASVTVMASWSEAVTNFTQQNLHVTGCGGSNISYFGQVGLKCQKCPGNPGTHAQLCMRPTRCVLAALGDCASSRYMSHMLHPSGPVTELLMGQHNPRVCCIGSTSLLDLLICTYCWTC